MIPSQNRLAAEVASTFGGERPLSLAVLLYEVSASDPVSIASTGVVLVVATLLASYLPARRAAAVDPNRALRGD